MVLAEKLGDKAFMFFLNCRWTLRSGIACGQEKRNLNESAADL
jgi:hypothetical protein